MDKLLVQLQTIKKEQAELKRVKLLETQTQQRYISNCRTLLKIYKSKKQDCIMENLIQMNESLRGIANDVQGFKSIRHRLFLQASSEKNSQNKLYLYIFHLFESLVCNISSLVQKSSNSLVAQLPPELNINQLNDQSSVLSQGKTEGFFAENLRSLIKSQQHIDEVVEVITKDQERNQKALKRRQKAMHQFMKELQEQELDQSVDNSFEVKWSLQELENIVYDFINDKGIPLDFSKESLKPLDVRKEDILKVQKSSEKDGLLPQMVRDYIIHDRGNSLFLSDSFANLPSPVNESQTIKQFFKPKEDQELNKKRSQDKSQNSNKDIKIEGKSKGECDDESMEKPQIDIDLKELDRFVFKNEPGQSRKAVPVYQEEESYLNPSNVSDYVAEEDYAHQRIHSISQAIVDQSLTSNGLAESENTSQIDSGLIRLNYNDVNIGGGGGPQFKDVQSSNDYSQQSKIKKRPALGSESSYKSQNPYANPRVNNLSIKILDEANAYSTSQSCSKQCFSIEESSEPSKPCIQNITHLEGYPEGLELYSEEESREIHVARSAKNISKVDISNQEYEGEELNSSCKNTIKMTEQEFSFFKDGVIASKSVTGNNLESCTPNKSKNAFWNNVQETLQRLNAVSNEPPKNEGKHPKNNPFRVDIQTIQGCKNDVSDERSYHTSSSASQGTTSKGGKKRTSSTQRQACLPKGAYQQKRDSLPGQQRSISPISSNNRGADQQNIGRCISLQNFDQLGKQPHTNIQPLTNKSVSTYDISTERGLHTPTLTSNQRLNSYRGDGLSKDPSKKSINTVKQRPQQDKQPSGVPSVSQSHYLKIIEGKVEKSQQKNFDALKIVLGQYAHQEGRNFVSASNRQYVHQSYNSNGSALKETERAYEFQRAAASYESGSIRDPVKIKLHKKKAPSRDPTKKSGSRETSKKRGSKELIAKREQANMSALPQIMRGGNQPSL